MCERVKNTALSAVTLWFEIACCYESLSFTSSILLTRETLSCKLSKISVDHVLPVRGVASFSTSCKPGQLSFPHSLKN